jgi:hypothetical protein
MTKLIATAEQTPAAAPSPERRAWEAPRLTTVVPLDRTMGGGAFSALENASYKTS